MRFRLIFLIVTAVGLSACTSSRMALDTPERVSDAVRVSTEDFLDTCRTAVCDPGSRLDSVGVDMAARQLTLYMNPAFAQIPFREETLAHLEAGLRTHLPDGLRGGDRNADKTVWDIEFRALGTSAETLIPNILAADPDPSKRPTIAPEPRPLVTPLDAPWRAGALHGRHIAVWPSHGWYWEGRLDRWEWQRARLFQTVEDVLPLSFVVPYLAPMLERAGANVHIPRERDFQHREVLVDNDSSTGDSTRYLEVGPQGASWKTGVGNGFAWREAYVDQENPFELGTYRFAPVIAHEALSPDQDPTAQTPAEIAWVPDIPEDGQYAVYVSWARMDAAAPDAEYRVHHAGGISRFRVDQRMSGGTWVYLGHFFFEKGVSPDGGAVRLSNEGSAPGTYVSADAVRFGGGMGSISRGGSTSGRPRFVEGARYWMQYAGMPASLVYNVTDTTNDYVDDYRGRAEWVNYLRGRPWGPNKNRMEGGLGVPVDLSLAFHTDAGVTGDSTTIGTLMIYSSTGAEGDRTYPDGVSRFANRDLGDLMQTQLTSDIRALYRPDWNRRAIWDRDYSEAVRPNVPGVLLELLSHQNFADMQLALDPTFRFHVARAIHKSMVRFLAGQYGFEPVISPLPPDHLAVETRDRTITLSWQSREDPLEPTATPSSWVVYMREDEGAFGNGIPVDQPTFRIGQAARGVLYSFRVSAVNEGGESLWSEEVSAGYPALPHARIPDGNALIVAGFDRLAAPDTVDIGNFRGFAHFRDEGVAEGTDVAWIGHQYDFDDASPWLDDDSPGHGASYATYETTPTIGNTFNYPSVHGRALLDAGFSVSTVSDEVLMAGVGTGSGMGAGFSTSAYDFMDVILGEERGPDFPALPEAFRTALARYVATGGSVLVSGAHVATDTAGPRADSLSRAFAAEVLGFTWRTDHAVQTGRLTFVPSAFPGELPTLMFNTDVTAPVYRVESPDALEPAGSAETLLRYTDNNMSAAVGRAGPGGVVVLGFPFETIQGAAERLRFMNLLIDYTIR
ncbi:MAG: hypothetical protein RIE53_05210 [Rhodothermales bacterium]